MNRRPTRRRLLGALAGAGASGLFAGRTAGRDQPVTQNATLAAQASALGHRIDRDFASRERRGRALVAGTAGTMSEGTTERVQDGGLHPAGSGVTDTQGNGDTATTETDQVFQRGGVILGYYGRPWSHSERVDSLRWLAGRGFDTFVFAPKNDPYQRANWRRPYPDDQFADFADEITVARSHGVEWVPNVSPGLPLIPGSPEPGTAPSRDICFSCPDDRQVLYDKLDRFFEAGVRTMMMSFDDVQKASSHPEDTSSYGPTPTDYGRMNRDLLNAIYDRYADRDPSFTLLTVLADYDGTEDTSYLQGVRSGAGLRDGVEVMWTGTAVVSPTIEPDDAAAYANHVDRDRVLVWDNYPVNDYTGGIQGQASRLFLGPYAGRAAELPAAVSGILANPMSQARASRVALGAIASYLDDPAGYDHERAWRASIRQEGGPVADALAAVAENSRSSTLDREESPVYVDARDSFLDRYDVDAFWPAAATRFRGELDREESAPSSLADHRPNLAAEAAPFLEQLRANATASRAGVDLLASQRPTVSATARRVGTVVHVQGIARPPDPTVVPGRLARFESAYGDTLDHRTVHGDRLGQDLATVYVNENRVDAFARDVVGRTATWAPTAGRAARSVRVTVDGEATAVDEAGRFETRVQSNDGVVPVVATDGAGNRTGRRVSVE